MKCVEKPAPEPMFGFGMVSSCPIVLVSLKLPLPTRFTVSQAHTPTSHNAPSDLPTSPRPALAEAAVLALVLMVVSA